MTLGPPPTAGPPGSFSEEKGRSAPSSDGGQKAQAEFGPAGFDKFGGTTADFRREKAHLPPFFNFQETDGPGANPVIC